MKYRVETVQERVYCGEIKSVKNFLSELAYLLPRCFVSTTFTSYASGTGIHAGRNLRSSLLGSYFISHVSSCFHITLQRLQERKVAVFIECEHLEQSCNSTTVHSFLDSGIPIHFGVLSIYFLYASPYFARQKRSS